MKLMIPNNHPGKSCAAAAVALGILSASIASTASAEVIAGWDTFSGTGAVDPVAAPIVESGITASFVTTTEQLPWNINDERGASNDGTWGSSVGPPPADTTVGTNNDQNLELPNATSGGTITFTIANNSGSDIDLGSFHFDANAFRFKAARAYELSVLPGGAITDGIIYTSADDEIPVGGPDNAAHADIDHDLTGLTDSTLENGGTIEFLLAFSSGNGDGSGGHDLWVDNIALTSVPATTNQLAVTVVPPSAAAGADFSVTVEAQDSGGSPINLTQDTDVSLLSSGAGTLSGNNGTILAGTSSVTFNMVQSTIAETITLNALRTDGDEILPSVASAGIEITAGPAAELFIETAADGTGSAIGDILLILGDQLDVFAVSRDAFGNFVANETSAEFSLINMTGEISEFDLDDPDLMDGTAIFYGDFAGTANIQATVSGLPDAVSGLITTAELTATWDRTGGNSSWSTAGNWVADILPDFDELTDLIFYAPVADDEDKLQSYLGADRTARSLNYNAEADANFRIRTTVSGTTGAAHLFLDTDSAIDPAEINIDADAEGSFTIGVATSPTSEYGDVILADNLLVTHNGTGTLTIDTVVSETGGSFGITKAGAGTFILSGTNTYTGPTAVDAGTMLINGDHAAATGAITVNNDAVLGGTGTVGGTVTVGAAGRISPGTAAGTLTMDGDLDISALAGGVGTLDFELAALADSSDSVEVNGNLLIGADLLGIGDLNITNLGGLEAGTYTLINSNTGITGTLDPADLTGTIAPGFSGELQIQDFSIVLVVTADASGGGIEITDIVKSGLDVTITFTSSGDVDVYRSTDLQNWGSAYEIDIPTGTYTDTAADLDSYYYLLVPAGDPAP